MASHRHRVLCLARLQLVGSIDLFASVLLVLTSKSESVTQLGVDLLLLCGSSIVVVFLGILQLRVWATGNDVRVR